MSALVEFYKWHNTSEGHDQYCGWGAGADCLCGAISASMGHDRSCPVGAWEDCTCGKDSFDDSFDPCLDADYMDAHGNAMAADLALAEALEGLAAILAEMIPA